MLSEEEAFAMANALPPSYFLPHDTDADIVAPITTRLRYYIENPNDMRRCTYLRETLVLWHALASCAGYSAAENPSFWARVVRNLVGSNLERPYFDRARFFPDPKIHPFPSVALEIRAGSPRMTLKRQQPQNRYQYIAHYLTRLMDRSTDSRSAPLVAALERLDAYIDPKVFSRAISVRLLCFVPFFNPINGQFEHYARTWTVSAFITMIHEWLVRLPRECMATETPEPGLVVPDGAVETPRFVVEAVEFIDLQDVRVEMSRALQSLLEDPRLSHIEFPHIGIEKIHQSTRPKTVRRFLSHLLRPNNVLRPLAPSPRLPQSLTLTLTDDGTDSDLGAHVELFFQLLPFTQSIQSLTLCGMNRCHQWGWLGFALFYPVAQRSSLRKLALSTPNYELASGTLVLYLEAARLRTSCVATFKAVVDSFGVSQMATTGETKRDKEPGLRPFTMDDVDVSAVPRTGIDHVTVDLTMATTDANWRHHPKDTYELSQWAVFLLTLAPSLQRIHVKPLHQYEPRGCYVGKFVSMASGDVLTLLQNNRHLKMLSVPARGWTTTQLVELFSRPALSSIELHADLEEIRTALQVLLVELDPRTRHHVQHLGLGILFGAFDPDDWRLCDALLDASPSLEYFYVHMGNLPQAQFRYDFGEHPPGDGGRLVKSRHGEQVRSSLSFHRQKLAFLSAIRGLHTGAGNVRGRLDSSQLSIILHLVRPQVRRFVGIDWADQGRLIAIEDAYATAHYTRAHDSVIYRPGG